MTDDRLPFPSAAVEMIPGIGVDAFAALAAILWAGGLLDSATPERIAEKTGLALDRSGAALAVLRGEKHGPAIRAIVARYQRELDAQLMALTEREPRPSDAPRKRRKPF